MRCCWCRRDGAGAVRRLETGDEWYHLRCWYMRWRLTVGKWAGENGDAGTSGLQPHVPANPLPAQGK